MSTPSRALVLLDNGIRRSTVVDALPNSPDLELVDVIEVRDGRGAPIEDNAFDVLLVACSNSSERALELIQRGAAELPDRPVVALHSGAEEAEAVMERLFEAGADDLIGIQQGPELILATLRKTIARKRAALAAGGERLCPLICVAGPKGGTGKTVVSCNLGVALAEAGRRAVIVDLDLRFGDVGLALGLSPERTIYDLARAGGSLDADKVAGYLTTHDSGVEVLLAPLRPDHASEIKPDFLSEVFGILRATHDYVVVDTPAGFSGEVISAIDNSTHVCMIGMLDAFSLKNTKLGLETLERMGYDMAATSVVLNRAESHVGITTDDVAQILGRRPDVLVPSERLIARSISEGIPLVMSHKRAPAAKAFLQLASLYLPKLSSNGDNGRLSGRLAMAVARRG